MTHEEYRNTTMLAWIAAYNITRLDLLGAIQFVLGLDQEEKDIHSIDVTMLSMLSTIKPDLVKLAFPPVEDSAVIVAPPSAEKFEVLGVDIDDWPADEIAHIPWTAMCHIPQWKLDAVYNRVVAEIGDCDSVEQIFIRMVARASLSKPLKKLLDEAREKDSGAPAS